MAQWSAAGLSREAQSCWGKFDWDDDSWMPLHRHLSDAAEVAGRLWDDWLPPEVRRIICGDLSEAQGRTIIRWLAAAHDLGKATPAFAGQVPAMTDRLRRAGLDAGNLGQQRIPHSIGSHHVLSEWLVQAGAEISVANAWACVPGGHHGTAPEHGQLSEMQRNSLQRGDESWARVQREFAGWVAAESGVQDMVTAVIARPPSPQAQILMTATVIVADWIASDASRFPFADGRSAVQRAESAWHGLDLPQPWSAQPASDDDVLFRSRFDLPAESCPRPVQRAVAQAARAATEPPLLVVEAPMGEGKTEAALLGAEILAEKFGRGGVFLALPTMATGDAMFRRVRHWVERLGAGRTSMHLAHGKAALNKDFQGIVRLGRLSSGGGDQHRHPRSGGFRDGCATDVTIAHEWLSGRKKGVLATFVVGTIDQILFGALRSRHLVLRHLALAGKVVVIDEVHSSDDYMAVYLSRVLHWLGAYGVPTVLLSATLSGARRDQLVQAYRSGLPAGSAKPARAGRRQWGSSGLEPSSDPTTAPSPPAGPLGYPLLTVADRSGVRGEAVPPSSRVLEVEINGAPDDEEHLIRLVTDAQREGGVVAIVRNTVSRAQRDVAALRSAFPDVEVVLAHSRFLAVDRQRNDQELRDRLGPPGSSDRPAAMIVVGTQVLEQSLDVDFDLLITDLAPMDLVLQRMGRLHRHERPAAVRGVMGQPRCVVVGDWSTAPPTFDEGSTSVYGTFGLIRAAAVLTELVATSATIRLPQDIPRLVEAAAVEDGSPEGWEGAWDAARQEAEQTAEARRQSAQVFQLAEVTASPNLIGWASLGVGDAESPKGYARVRDGDDSLEVLVVQRVGGHSQVLPWIERVGGKVLPDLDLPEPECARAVATCSVRLPPDLSGQWIIDKVIDELDLQGRATWQKSPWLQGELILTLDENFEAVVAGKQVRYSRDLGLQTGPFDE